MKEYILSNGWHILQDVKDCGEEKGIFKTEWNPKNAPFVFSEWEPIDRLTHLQLLLAEQPYFGRELRYFNNAPWWYKKEFDVSEAEQGQNAILRFEGVDYYCKIWLNGDFIGEHEGYSTPFEFDVTDHLKYNETNSLIVKVWSPWDKSTLSLSVEGFEFGMTIHDMVKGTYEHSDGFIQRDVNPVGIWKDVKLAFYPDIRISGNPFITTDLKDNFTSADVKISIPIINKKDSSEVRLEGQIIDGATGLLVASTNSTVPVKFGEAAIDLDLVISNPKIWNTWDRGTPYFYTAKIKLISSDGEIQEVVRRFGVRKVEIRRSVDETTFILNGKDWFVRGTSYFPDVYVSKLSKEQYSRDLKAMKWAGFNLVRVHVHVANNEFYDLCDEIGIAVMQDSDLNWLHPVTEEFKDRAVKVFGDMIKNLRNHPSIACWVCMNEPDLWLLAVEMGMMKNVDPMPVSMMKVSPGPQLVEALKQLDPTRPYIKGSIQQNDLESGDTHNYLGSLMGEMTQYTDALMMPEKLNTEFGFDAPACKANLMRIPEIYNRLRTLIEEHGIERLQYYQYRLLKFFVEHYRIAKYKPCSGYIQFLFTDIGPQSFYGLYDWWGLPKEGLKALEESNQPIGVFMEYKDEPIAIWVVNDLLEAYKDCTVEWVVSNSSGMEIVSGSQKIDISGDSVNRLCDLTFDVDKDEVYDVHFFVKDSKGQPLTSNTYKDAFHHPPHPKGHPGDMNHEIGMRVFGT